MLTLAPTGRRFRRVARALTALCVLTMLGSNALAAMGLCLVKTTPSAAAVTVADETPCVRHVDQGSTPSSREADAKHCPQDDPGAQLRAGDVPAASIMPAITNPLRIILGDSAVALLEPRTPEDAPPTPLYARLSRLLL